MYSAANVAIAGAFLAVIAYVGGRMAASGSISVGEFVAVVGLAQFLRGPLIDIIYFGAGLARARASANRVAALLGTGEAVTPAGEPVSLNHSEFLTLREREPFAVFATADTMAALTANPIFAVLAPDLVTRKIDMRIEIWDREPLEGQESIIGRTKGSGATSQPSRSDGAMVFENDER